MISLTQVSFDALVAAVDLGYAETASESYTNNRIWVKSSSVSSSSGSPSADKWDFKVTRYLQPSSLEMTRTMTCSFRFSLNVETISSPT